MLPAPPCPHCGYSLEGCRPTRDGLWCPECGERFSLDTSELRLPFLPLIVASVGVQLTLLIACALLEPGTVLLGLVGFFYIVAVLAAPAVFAAIWSQRWLQPWRTAVHVRYLVAGYALSVVACGVSLLALGVLRSFV